MAKDQGTGPEADAAQTGFRSDADLVAADGGMVDVTPRGLEPDQVTSSRMAATKAEANKGERGSNLVRLLYEGRKMPSGRASTRTPAGEEVDVIVPSIQGNEDAVEDYKSVLPPVHALTHAQKVETGYNQVTPETVHLDGFHYHFTKGETTDVYPEDLTFLKGHKEYAFTEVPKAQ